MKRITLIALIDVLAFMCFVFLVSTGILLEYLLPPGSGRWALIWSMNRHQWGDIHFWFAVIFFSVLLIHLFLHWRFIVSLVQGRVKRQSLLRPALGILAFIVLLALAVAPLLSPVEKQANGGRGLHNIEERLQR